MEDLLNFFQKYFLRFKVTPFIKTTETWNHQPLAYPLGKAEVTELLVEIVPGGETGWHLHPVPSFGMVLQGELGVMLKDGEVKHLKAGDALAETINTLHNGKTPVKIAVFCAGAEGQTLTVKEVDVKPPCCGPNLNPKLQDKMSEGQL